MSTPLERIAETLGGLPPALDERPRHDIGMITVAKTFYQVVDTPHRAPDGGTAEPQTLQATAAATP